MSPGLHDQKILTFLALQCLSELPLPLILLSETLLDHALLHLAASEAQEPVTCCSFGRAIKYSSVVMITFSRKSPE
jgi:hypothetical protein